MFKTETHLHTSEVSRCGKLLEEAELQIKKVIKTADGTPALEDFADEG